MGQFGFYKLFFFLFQDSGFVGDEKGGRWFDIQIDIEVLFSKFIYLMFHNTLYRINNSTDTEKIKNGYEV